MKPFELIFAPKTWLALALLGAVAAPSAQAAPDPNPSRNSKTQDDGRDSDRNRDDYRRDQNGEYETVRAYTGEVLAINSDREFQARVDGRTYKIYATSATRGLRVGQTVSIRGQMFRGRDIRNASVSVLDNRNDNRSDYWRDRDGRDYYDPNGKRRDIERGQDKKDRRDEVRVLDGVVTRVRNDREFEMRADSTTYKVRTKAATRRLTEGDWVRVSSRKARGNELRDADVTITRNRGDRDNNGYNPDRTYRGDVTSVRNDREFDVRIDGRTYRVYSASRVRDLNRGDEVRVTGRRDNDAFRDADVTITRHR